MAFVSIIEPKNLKETIIDDHWIIAMQEELNQFKRNDVWELVEKPLNYPIIGTKWVFRDKIDENGIVIRNKARLVAKGYNQEEGIDYEETFAPCHTLISFGDYYLMICNLWFAALGYLASFVSQYVKSRDMPEIKRKQAYPIREIP